MPVQPMLLHRMALVSFRLFCKNLGNLQEFFGQMVYRPPWPEIARTPMHIPQVRVQVTGLQIIKQEQKCLLALILIQNDVFDRGEITWFT